MNLGAATLQMSGAALKSGRFTTSAKCLAVSALCLTMATTQAAAAVVLSGMKVDDSPELQSFGFGKVTGGAMITVDGDGIFSLCDNDENCFEFRNTQLIQIKLERGEVYCPVQDSPSIQYCLSRTTE